MNEKTSTKRIQLIIKSKKKHVFKKYISEIIVGVIISVILPAVTFCWNLVAEEVDLYKNLNSISLGTSEQYMEQCFGAPKFQYMSEEYNILENVYFTDREIIRAYFIDNKLEGYFVTKVKDGVVFKVKLPEEYENFTNGKALGDFSFYEINNSPSSITAYATQGYSHYLYFEDYYFAMAGRYHEFYFGYFDYGYESQMEYDQNYRDDKVELDVYVYGIQPFNVNRKTSYPNTYGICTAEYRIEIFELVSDYYKFDW